jgi:hypothetical protein
MKLVSFALEEGTKYYGRVDDGGWFFVGRRVAYEGGKGLMNVTGTAAQRYRGADFRPQFGFWADFIQPTAAAEGALFHTLNTYDRARFTFTFLQYAAHVPNGDFVRFMRTLLQLPQAGEYFPDLVVEGGRIVRIAEDGTRTALESDGSTAGLLDYLNPSRAEVEDTEVIQAVKLVHWAQNDPAHRRVQIEVGIAHFKRNLLDYAKRYGLDGSADVVCLVIADIRHQGRAKSVDIVAALAGPKPLEALLAIGKEKYPGRIASLRREIKALTDAGVLGTKKYSVAKKDFVAA